MRRFRQASGRLAAHTRRRQFRGHGSAVPIQHVKNTASGGGSLHLLYAAALPQPSTEAADCSSVQLARPLVATARVLQPAVPRQAPVVRSILLTNLFRQGPSSAAGGGSSCVGHLDSFCNVMLLCAHALHAMPALLSAARQWTFQHISVSSNTIELLRTITQCSP